MRETKGILAPYLVPLHPEAVREKVRRAAAGDRERELRCRRKAYPFWEVLECGALRDASGLKQEEIAEGMGLTVTGVRRRLAVHEEALRVDAGYATEYGGVTGRARSRNSALRGG